MKSKENPISASWLLLTYVLFLMCATIYSYSLIDPNLTLLNSHYWETFRNASVQFGYLNRHDAWLTYIVLIVLAFFLHRRIQKHLPINPITLACITAGITVFAYPYASHDLFNYIFDAHIFTHYGMNPYVHVAGNFPTDPWIRFMHWTHRTYPYGPTFLPITLLVSFLSFNKLILNFLFFKGLFALAYLGSVWHLTRMKKSWGMYMATHPLIIFEGLVNAHNDMLAVYFGLAGIALLYHELPRSKRIWSRCMLMISAGIKYFTLPTLIIQKPQSGKQHIGTYGAYAGVIALIAYVSVTSALQPWYFLNLFLFIPYFKRDIEVIDIFMMGLLLSYFPLIRYGSWDRVDGLDLKLLVLTAFTTLNVVWIIAKKLKRLPPSQVV